MRFRRPLGVFAIFATLVVFAGCGSQDRTESPSVGADVVGNSFETVTDSYALAAGKGMEFAVSVDLRGLTEDRGPEWFSNARFQPRAELIISWDGIRRFSCKPDVDCSVVGESLIAYNCLHSDQEFHWEFAVDWDGEPWTTDQVPQMIVERTGEVFDATERCAGVREQLDG